jgi:hypothetical protein
MTGSRLDRRTVLRGAGGLAMALPALDIMARGARAASRTGARPGRFVLSYVGISTGKDGKQDDSAVPRTTGAAYERTRGLASLVDLGVDHEVTVVSGLTLPYQTKPDGEIPAAGRRLTFHGHTVGPMITGVRSAKIGSGQPQGSSADQLVADAIGADTQFKVLAYRMQPMMYSSANDISMGQSGALSWRRRADGSVARQDPIYSPRLAYESLFTGLSPASADPAEAARAREALQRRKSVLDFVAEDARRLLPRLGRADRQRMERHADELRALEERLGTLPTGAGQACRVPESPGDDPPLGGACRERMIRKFQNGTCDWASAGSDEERRSDLLTDLIRLAFACDQTRAVSYMLTPWKSWLPMFPFTGMKSDAHELTHGQGSADDLADAVSWFVRQWGKLIGKLARSVEPDGTTLLDHTAMVLLWEGGHGFDAETGKGASPHSTENMMALVAGRAGGLRPGRHVRAKDRHPAQVVLSAMNAVGATTPRLGEVEGPLPELFG